MDRVDAPITVGRRLEPVERSVTQRGITRRFRAAWPLDTIDILVFVGWLLLGGSIALVWVPLAGVVMGALLLVFAFVAGLPTRTQP
jgi:hypothetical protein